MGYYSDVALCLTKAGAAQHPRGEDYDDIEVNGDFCDNPLAMRLVRGIALG